jgi:squalene-associated FAD-dependent desaturase
VTASVHIIGAGMAGLAAAIAVSATGRKVVLHEAAPTAGGRCRSFHDPILDRVIDNGTHLVLGANRHTLAFIRAVGGSRSLEVGEAAFPFHDPESGQSWIVSPGRLGAGFGELVRALGLPWTGPRQTVAQRLGRARSFRTLWEPLCVSALNTPAHQASARLFARLLRALIGGGASALQPVQFPHGLSAAMVDPALASLAAWGAEVRFGHRLTGLDKSRLVFGSDPITLSAEDRVILAVPAWAARRLIPDLPQFDWQPIAAVHFRASAPVHLPAPTPFMMVIGPIPQWISVRDDVVSVTMSAYGEAPDVAHIWRGLCRIIAQPPTPVPPHRIIIERRATLLHGPDTLARRPPPEGTPFPQVVLAGDWLASPWPCTIEAAIASGLEAARRVVGQDDLRFPC